MFQGFLIAGLLTDYSSTLVKVLPRHRNAEPASSCRSLDRGALNKDVLVEANLCDFTFNVNADVLRLQVDVQSISGHELRHLEVKYQLRTILALINAECVASLIAVSWQSMLVVHAGWWSLSNKKDES